MLMDAKEGARRADMGMKKAIDHAGQAWADHAIAEIRHWAKNIAEKGKLYAFEDIRHHCVNVALFIEPPPTHKAWGALAQRAVRESIIHPTDQYRKAKSVGTHGHPVKLYKALK